MKKHPYLMLMAFFIFAMIILIIFFSVDDFTGIGLLLNPLEFAFITLLAYLGGRFIKLR